MAKILHINLKARGQEDAEFRFFWDNPNDYQTGILSLADIASLNDRADTDYYTRIPVDYAQTGQLLFNWLDGSDRLFSRALTQCSRGEQTVLAIATSGRLANLPWELLHDGTEFLIQRDIVPVRWLTEDKECLTVRDEPKNRFLNVLFMATSPHGVKPELDFEAEEGRIITATQRKRSLCLTVEESGNLEELRHLVEDYERDYFDVVHLTGHADIDAGTPYFLTETEFGDRRNSSGGDIARSLQKSKPNLIFLSGCRTGYTSGDVLPSLAEALLQEGARAVLSWGDRVNDDNASRVAAMIYEQLSVGSTVTEAIAQTYRELLEYCPSSPIKGKLELKSDLGGARTQWHLLRLYIADTLPGALVTAPKTKGRKRAPSPTVTDLFIDDQRRLRVLPRTEFVGRRRRLQNCLQVLKTDWDKVGVLLHGMGGLGKTTIAARLCDRLSDYETLVWCQQVDEGSFAKVLAEKLTREARKILNDSSEDLKYRLRDVFAELNEMGAKPFLLVFDDFEWNLAHRDGGYILQVKAAEVLESLVWAIRETDSPHRIIITCRYKFDSDLLHDFFLQPLESFHHSDLQKKLKRLQHFNSDKIAESVIQRALNLAAGNPRLLEWLNDEVLCQEDAAARLTQLENSSEDWKRKIIWDELYQQIDKPLTKILSRCLVYEISVPIPALEAVCEDIPQYREQLQRAIALGLLEVSSDVEECDRVYRVYRILPRIIPSIHLPSESDAYPVYRKAWEGLTQCWGNTKNEDRQQYNKDFKKWYEIFRLKFADLENSERFREGFFQMLTLQPEISSKMAFRDKIQEDINQLSAIDLCKKLGCLLQQENWKDADKETTWIFYQIFILDKIYKFRSLCHEFPVQELNKIDMLWVKYSQGKFGFSVQKEIWESMGGNFNADETIWKKFSKRVGWYDGKKYWKYYEYLNFSKDEAIKGELPAGWTTRTWIRPIPGLIELPWQNFVGYSAIVHSEYCLLSYQGLTYKK
ncbi:GUN4 domain-containing protein [Spirulina sp. 06S082]|uniref:GUN4 domain-containing protein n=1 Tax=Spirulina sp. 06S082 TaxID=3110248 RepID=UPI002B21B0C8|nr:GUN4 domain-containing protein [Spirulina sp. 06S082]MEA5469556.1 GUN4 domain-containing protein [Spirulina sp. 06S082]